MAVKASYEVTVTDQTDAKDLVTWYQLSTSATKPSKPTTTSASATPTGWTKAEPSYDPSQGTKYLYTCQQLVWGDGTCGWGDVQLSSSYEAAKSAVNAAAAASEEARDAYSKIQSRGEQLITNGNGFMGDNTNFSSLTFDGSVTNGSPGSFTDARGTYFLPSSDEMFPVDPSKNYRVEFDVTSSGSGASPKMCGMFYMYDVDKNLMNVHQCSYIVGSTTTLARELKNGDTTVYLTDASGFIDTSAAHQRSLIFWDYTNSFGYTYPPETYSRNFVAPSAGLWSDYSKIDKTNNTIKLISAWTGGTHVAGTSVSQNSSGSIYSYFWSTSNVQAGVWTHVSSVYDGYQPAGISNASHKFYRGTAYCRIAWLWNYQGSASNPQRQLWVTNISVREDVATSAELNTAKANAVKRTQRIYCRKSSVGAPSTPGTASSNWVTQTSDVFDQWTAKVPRLTANVDGTGTKYPYLYTCEQREMGDGTLAYTTVLIDDSDIVIDGGNIIVGSVAANRLVAHSISGDQLTIGVNSAIENGAKTATNYIQADETGIRIADANPATATTYQHQTATNTEFVVDGVSRAEISGDGARFGKEYVEGATDNESHLELDYHSLRLVDKNGTEFFEVRDLRDENGNVAVSKESQGNGSFTTFSMDHHVELSSVEVFVNGTKVTSGWTATDPPHSQLTPGTQVTFTTAPASGDTILITGTVTDQTVTEKMKSYTFGTRADGTEGAYSLATGYLTRASGPQSQAHGIGTWTSAPNEIVIGRYNTGAAVLTGRLSDAINGVPLVIGNGSSTSRSNALVVAWDGTVYHQGDVPWTNFPLASTAAHYSSSKPLRYRKWGNMVNLLGAVVPKAQVAKEGTLTIGTLPAGCRPIGELTELCQGSGTASWMLRITTGGVVTAERYRNASGYQVMTPHTNGSGGAWLTFNCTFIVA